MGKLTKRDLEIMNRPASISPEHMDKFTWDVDSIKLRPGKWMVSFTFPGGSRRAEDANGLRAAFLQEAERAGDPNGDPIELLSAFLRDDPRAEHMPDLVRAELKAEGWPV